VASTQTLLYAAESDVTIERVRALVKQVGPEAPTVEYKTQMADTIAKGVAALANTYGGLLLVGVTDDRQVRGVREKTIEAVAEHCRARLEPPWVPPIIPVSLGHGSDLYVLVLRVVPGQHPRPLLVDGAAPVRHQNTTHPADWQRLKDMFTEAGAVVRDNAWVIQAPSVPQGADGTSDSTVDLVIRSGLDFPVSREAKWRPLSEKTFTGRGRVIDWFSGRRRQSIAGAGHQDLGVVGRQIDRRQPAGIRCHHRHARRRQSPSRVLQRTPARRPGRTPSCG
jgi:hypothetical protein